MTSGWQCRLCSKRTVHIDQVAVPARTVRIGTSSSQVSLAKLTLLKSLIRLKRLSGWLRRGAGVLSLVVANLGLIVRIGLLRASLAPTRALKAISTRLCASRIPGKVWMTHDLHLIVSPRIPSSKLQINLCQKVQCQLSKGSSRILSYKRCRTLTRGHPVGKGMAPVLETSMCARALSREEPRPPDTRISSRSTKALLPSLSRKRHKRREKRRMRVGQLLRIAYTARRRSRQS